MALRYNWAGWIGTSGRSISETFAEPNLYALGWIKLRCHGSAVLGESLKHLTGFPHRARTLSAASGIGIDGFGARSLLQAMQRTGGGRTGSRLRDRGRLT